MPDDRFPSAELVETRPTVGEWGLIDNDGNRACWWCLCTVHPSVTLLHDRWHLRNWEARA